MPCSRWSLISHCIINSKLVYWEKAKLNRNGLQPSLFNHLIFLRELSPRTFVIWNRHIMVFSNWWKGCFGYRRKVSYDFRQRQQLLRFSGNGQKKYLISFEKTSPARIAKQIKILYRIVAYSLKTTPNKIAHLKHLTESRHWGVLYVDVHRHM